MKRVSACLVLVALATLLTSFAWWSVSTARSVANLRTEVAQRVHWLSRSRELHHELEEATPKTFTDLTLLAREIGAEETSGPALRAAARRVDLYTTHANARPQTASDLPDIAAAVERLEPAIRKETALISVKLGEHWDALNVLVVVALLGAASTVGLLIYLYFVSLAGARRRVAELRRGLEKADRLAAVGTLAASVAHEINNPLAVVKANLQSILEGSTMEADDPHRKMLARTLEGADRIERCVRNLRTYAEPSRGTLRRVEVKDLINTALNHTQSELARVARVERDFDRHAKVRVDPRKTVQVLVNLLLNAVEAMADKPPQQRVLRLTTTVSDDSVEISVADTGNGVDPSVRDTLFEAFVSTKRTGEGTGLGLFVCNETIDALGGNLDFTSTAGRGSTFTVTLPLHLEGTSSQRSTNTPRAAMRVLIVDDEPMLAAAIAQMLPHRVDTATEPELALTRLEQGRYDAVLCDIRMPGTDGLALFDRVTKKRPELARAFVFMSGAAVDPKLHARLSALPNRCLEKPFRSKELRDALSDVLRSSS